MNIKIVCVGKLKEKYFKDGIAEYVKRMSRFAKVKIVQVPDEKAPEKLSPAEMEQVNQSCFFSNNYLWYGLPLLIINAR